MQAFPVIVKCLTLDIRRSKLSQPSLPGFDAVQPLPLSPSNCLLLFVSQVFKFFFDMKFSPGLPEEAGPNSGAKGAGLAKAGEQEDEEMNNEDEGQYSDEDQEDLRFRRQAHLSCLLCQLKREKQSKNWSQAVGGPGVQNRSPMLKFFLSNCSLDLSLLADTVTVICLLTQDRPLRQGAMGVKDVKRTQSFNEVLIEHVTSNLGAIQDSLTSAAGAQLARQFKEAVRSDPFSAGLFAASCQLAAGE